MSRTAARSSSSTMSTSQKVRKREAVIAFFLAIAVLGGILLLAGTVALTGVDEFTRQVGNLFQIDLSKPKISERQSEYTQDRAEAFAKTLRRQNGKALFREPANKISPQILDPAKRDLLPRHSQMPLRPQRTPGQNDPRYQFAERAASRLAAPANLPIIARRKLRSAERDRAPVLTATGGRGSGGGGGVGENPANGTLGLTPLPMPAGPKFRSPEALRPVRQAASLPDSANTISRRLLDSRPPNGFPSLDKDIEAEFSVYRVPGDRAAFFRLRLRLKPQSPLPTLSKDVLFLVDISQSISRRELAKVRAAVTDYLSGLPKTDRYNVVLFGERTYSLHEGDSFVSVANFDAARTQKFIARRAGERRTDVFNAAQSILARIPASNRPSNVFLISDGMATQGPDEVRAIVNGFRRLDRANFSIFTFNGGAGGDLYLLRLLSYRSRGFFMNAPEPQKIRNNLLRFFRTYDRPVLTNVVASYTNLRLSEVYPAVMPNLYRDHPVTIWGRTIPGREVAIRVAGLSAGGPREFFFRAKVPQGDASQPEILRQWAVGKVHALTARLGDNPHDEGLRNEIRTLAQKYQLNGLRSIVGGGGWSLSLPWKKKR